MARMIKVLQYKVSHLKSTTWENYYSQPFKNSHFTMLCLSQALHTMHINTSPNDIYWLKLTHKYI